MPISRTGSQAFNRALIAITHDRTWEAHVKPFMDHFTDAWDVLMFEIMSQQTQADRALLKHEAFKEAWPNVTALANADHADVIALWTGLGYFRRATNLHRCAQVIATEYQGHVPKTYAELIALPGIGPYTANAVLAFAYNQPVMPIDTNIARIIARIANQVFTKRALETFVTSPDVGLEEVTTYPQASKDLMTLGASICVAKGPRCDVCPVQPLCLWNTGGGDDPATKGAYKPTKQATYKGSNRHMRGVLVRALQTKAHTVEELLQLATDELPATMVEPALAGLVADGLVHERKRGNRISYQLG